MDTQIVRIAAAEIIPGANDRLDFDPQALSDLAASIREHGLIQPISVRAIEGTDVYEVIAGERRLRACKLLGMEEIPCIILSVSDEEASAIMLSENIARADLNAIEEGAAYAKRIELYGWSVQQIAERAGVTPVRVQFRLKLLKLRPEIQDLVRTGNMLMGYAQTLADAALDNNRQMFALRVLQANATPTTGWFRQIVSEQAALQAQETMFDDIDFTLNSPDALAAAASHSVPSATPPPGAGGSPRETLQLHIAHWMEAAQTWAKMGKTFRKQECEAAATALRLVLANI